MAAGRGDVAEGGHASTSACSIMPIPAEELGLDTDYWEPYASVGFNLGPADATVGVAYAWEQDSLGGDDNLYLYTDLGYSPFRPPRSR